MSTMTTRGDTASHIAGEVVHQNMVHCNLSEWKKKGERERRREGRVLELDDLLVIVTGQDTGVVSSIHIANRQSLMNIM